MKRKKFLLTGILIVLLAAVGVITLAAGQSEIAEIKAATAQFHRPEEAQATGWDLVEGLDHCFDNPGVGGMGFHYINIDLLDANVDLLQPEALVYAPGPNDQLQLGGVEYIVPADAWTEAGNSEPPSALGQHFHLNEELGVYVLHAWIWKNNPEGLYEDWNPNVSCP